MTPIFDFVHLSAKTKNVYIVKDRLVIYVRFFFWGTIYVSIGSGGGGRRERKEKQKKGYILGRKWEGVVKRTTCLSLSLFP